MLVSILIRIGKWSELIDKSTVQLQAGRQFGDAMDRSGEVQVVAVILVGMSSFSNPRSASSIQSARSRPLASSSSSEFHIWWWPLRSPSSRKVSPRPSAR